jgi:hypothetical protein
MKVVWSDDAVMALVALETKLTRRYTAEKAPEQRVALDHGSLGGADRPRRQRP